MTTTLTAPSPSPASGLTGATPLRVTQARVIKSEWIKFRSLRSTFWTLFLAFACTVGLGMLVSALRARDISRNAGPGFQRGLDLPVMSLRGVFLAQLPIGVLGVLMITGEYGTGMIRATLSAVPKRLPVLWAKIVVFAVAVFVVGGVGSLLAFEFGQALFQSGAGFHATLSTPYAARAVLGGGLYLVAIGLLAVGLGFLIRNTAAAIATLFGLLLVVPVIIEALPTWLNNDIAKFLPLLAGTQIMTTVRDANVLSAWEGFGVVCIYAAVAIGLGAVMLKRHDA
ncbi:MAG: ABC transporter permease [Acidimicrobiales bacterium]